MANQTVDGSFTATGDANIGGAATVAGGATINHDLKVLGKIVCDNITSVFKGQFNSAQNLNVTYPNPRTGWYAYVTSGSGQKLYNCVGGKWVNTGQDVFLGSNTATPEFSALEERMTGCEEDLTLHSNQIHALYSATSTATSTLNGYGTRIAELEARPTAGDISDIREAQARCVKTADIGRTVPALNNNGGIIKAKHLGMPVPRIDMLLALQLPSTMYTSNAAEDPDDIGCILNGVELSYAELMHVYMRTMHYLPQEWRRWHTGMDIYPNVAIKTSIPSVRESGLVFPNLTNTHMQVAHFTWTPVGSRQPADHTATWGGPTMRFDVDYGSLGEAVRIVKIMDVLDISGSYTADVVDICSVRNNPLLEEIWLTGLYKDISICSRNLKPDCFWFLIANRKRFGTPRPTPQTPVNVRVHPEIYGMMNPQDGDVVMETWTQVKAAGDAAGVNFVAETRTSFLTEPTSDASKEEGNG